MKSAPLGDLATIVSGATPKSGSDEYWGGEVRWATPADLSKLDGAYISETSRRLTDAGVRSCAAKILPVGSVLLSSRAPIGHVAINTVPMATNQGFKSLVPGPNVDAKYLYHWIKSKTDYLQSLGNGATFKELSKSVTAKIEIPLPSLEEQRRIAALLDHADALRRKRSQVLTNIDALTESIFEDMFGSEITGNYRVELRSLTALITKGTTPTSVGLKFTSEGVPFVRVQNLQQGMIRFSSGDLFIGADAHQALRRSAIRPRDLLVSIAGTIGRVSIVSEDAPEMNCNQAVAIIRLTDLAIGPWLMAWLNSRDAKRQIGSSSVTATISNLSLSQIGQLRVPVINEDAIRRFARRSDAKSAQRNIALASQAAGEGLFASLQSRAFQGDL